MTNLTPYIIGSDVYICVRHTTHNRIYPFYVIWFGPVKT